MDLERGRVAGDKIGTEFTIFILNRKETFTRVFYHFIEN